MPDVSSTAPERVRLWVALDVHKFSIVAATLGPAGGTPELHRIETTEAAIKRLVGRLGGPGGLAVCYEAGPGGYDLLRLLGRLGVACDVIAPSLVPVRAGDRVKTDKRDAKKLVRLYRAGELRFVAPPSPEQEGLRDLVRCRDDVRRARTAARHQVAKQLLRHGRIYREGKTAWTLRHRAWVRRQTLDHPLAQRALEHARAHLDSLDAQLAAIDAELARIADTLPWRDPVRWLRAFRGIGYRTALGLLAEIGDWRRLAPPRAQSANHGLVATAYYNRVQRHRGPITKTRNQHARRLLVEAAWHYQHRPRRAAAETDLPPEVAARAWQAQVRLHHRHRSLTEHGKRSTVATVAVARELAGFLWAAMTCQPLRDTEAAAA
jgi:transposase